MTGQAMQRGQHGAALVVVLLLVATLSFIVLSISERTVFAASRSTNARLRGELLWRAYGVEALAAAALAEAAKASSGKMTAEDALFAAPREIPMEGGAAVVAFADRTRCFNLNSLVAADQNGSYSENPTSAGELERIFAAAGGEFTGARLIASIIDWIDADTLQRPEGAEDDYYAGLAVPYRTGGALLADVSEARAMAGVDRGLYVEAQKHVCVQPSTDASPINVNLLEAQNAPLIASLAPGLTAAQALDVIAARPPGGYPSVAEFWAHPAFAGKEIGEEARARVKLTSRFIEAYAAIEYEGASSDLRLLFEISENGDVVVVSRRLGRYE